MKKNTSPDNLRCCLFAHLLVLLVGPLSFARPLPLHGLHYEKPATVWDEAFPLGNGLLGALVWGDGKRTLPLSSSPEINDDRLEAWFPTITNYDLALIRWAFRTAAELADRLGKDRDAARWGKVLSEMPQLALDSESRRLLVAKDYRSLQTR